VWYGLNFSIFVLTLHLIKSTYEPQKIVDAKPDIRLHIDVHLEEQ
jgi:hypothetical protein